MTGHVLASLGTQSWATIYFYARGSAGLTIQGLEAKPSRETVSPLAMSGQPAAGGAPRGGLTSASLHAARTLSPGVRWVTAIGVTAQGTVACARRLRLGGVVALH